MPVYVGFLRAVNVGGQAPVPMDALRAFLSHMGFEDVRSLLQSGNVAFRSDERDSRKLERELEERAAEDLGLRTDFFVRTANEWNEVVRANPFPQEAESAPNHLLVTVLKEAPPPVRWRALESAISGRERVQGAGRQAYIVYPDGIGRSRLTPALIEKHLATRGTSRNWNTVTKLAAIASGP